MDPLLAILALLGVLLVAVIIARIITTAFRVSTSKRCPSCAELVKAKAVKCRYCGEPLS